MLVGYFEAHGRMEGFAELEMETILNVFEIMKRSFDADVVENFTFTEDRIDGKFLIRTLDFPTWCEVRDCVKTNLIGRGLTVELVGGAINNEPLDEDSANILINWQPMPKPKPRKRMGLLKKIFGSKAIKQQSVALGDIYPDECDEELWDDWDDWSEDE